MDVFVAAAPLLRLVWLTVLFVRRLVAFHPAGGDVIGAVDAEGPVLRYTAQLLLAYATIAILVGLLLGLFT